MIGELIEGWDTLLEIECACVQPLSYYYPNNQHLIAYMEQTGSENDPILLERIAAGLQTDSFVPGFYLGVIYFHLPGILSFPASHVRFFHTPCVFVLVI